jgi:hypothetical protein
MTERNERREKTKTRSELRKRKNMWNKRINKKREKYVIAFTSCTHLNCQKTIVQQNCNRIYKHPVISSHVLECLMVRKTTMNQINSVKEMKFRNLHEGRAWLRSLYNTPRIHWSVISVLHLAIATCLLLIHRYDGPFASTRLSRRKHCWVIVGLFTARCLSQIRYA